MTLIELETCIKLLNAELDVALTKSDYKKYLRSARWKTRNELYKEFTGWHCMRCKKMYTKYLSLHHLRYSNLGREPLEDLILLCRKCHYI